jgi:hypothetical protein
MTDLDEALVRAGRYLRRGVVSADLRTLEKGPGVRTGSPRDPARVPGGGPPLETGMGTGQAARVLTGRLGLLKL